MRRAVLLATLLVATTVRGQETPPVCTFGPGALPADTLPAGTPHGAQIPLDTIVVLMQENRSFDHYFGLLQRAGKKITPRKASNPDPTGGQPIRRFHEKRYCEVADLDHSWSATHSEWNGGAMDGFTAANVDPGDLTGSRTMGYFTRADLPFYYKLYQKFPIGDHYFCSLLGPTFPNRFYLLTGTSAGRTRNVFTTFSGQSIFQLLDAAGVSWKIYYSQLPFAALIGYVQAHLDHTVAIDQYFTDAAAGTLPQVAFLDPIFLDDENVENDEHPPANVQIGQEFVARVVRALFASPQWNQAAMFLMYDEHGGFYDHVPPPPACVPDATPPNLQPTDPPGAFDRYGIRVPVVVVSPWARKRFVSHVVHDHTSILRFIETRFDLPALTNRDANADPMLEFFDFSRRGFANPPLLPAAVIDPTHAAQCMP